MWHGYDLLDEGPARREWDRCLVFLSPGGTDAQAPRYTRDVRGTRDLPGMAIVTTHLMWQVAREFDLTTKKFVEGGFETTKAEKCDVGFRTRDEVINHDVLIIITR